MNTLSKIALLMTLILLCNQALAQRIIPGTDHPIWEKDGDEVISVRPRTTARMESVKSYMQAVEARSAPEGQKYSHARSKINEWKAEIATDPFYRRDHPHDINDGTFSETAHMIGHIAQDIWRATDDLLGSCGDIAFPNAGFCWKKKFCLFGACYYDSPRPIKSYRLPIQMIELVENRGQTGYMLQPITYGATLAGEWLHKMLATGLDEGLADIPVIGELLSGIAEPISDLFGDTIGYDVKLTTRLMDTTAKVVGLRDHLYLYGCENIDPGDYTALANCIKDQFFDGYKDISDFDFYDRDGNLIEDHMVKHIRNQEITIDGRTDTPYEDFSTRYHNYSEPQDGYRYVEYHLYQPSPYHETVIQTLRNIQIYGVYIFRPIIGACERRLPKITYFSEWPFAFGDWAYGTGGLNIIMNRGIPVPTGILYSRSVGASYMDYVIARRGSGIEGTRMRQGHRQRFFDYREFENIGRLAGDLADGSHNSSADPFACARANMRWSRGRTPNDMLYPLVRGERPPDGLPQAPGSLAGPNPASVNVEPGVCQGANMGSWAPALSRTTQLHGPSASELAFVKAITTVRANPSSRIRRRAYRIDTKRDQIQWLRDEDMRDIEEGCHDFGSRAGWEYHPDQISRDVEKDDHDDEFWNVGLHWKRFRCCAHRDKRCEWSLSDPPTFFWCGSDGDLFDIRE